MSKKKNTLKDLDEFLKQQAAALVSPPKLSDKAAPPQHDARIDPGQLPEPTSMDQVLKQMQELAGQEGKDFRTFLYDFIIKSIEDLNQYLPEDRMLINTAL